MFEKKTIINLILKSHNIVLKYAKQGMPGRRGQMGLPGQDAVNWEAVITMEGVPNGTCTIKLYKDGILSSEEIHFAAVYVMPTNSSYYSQSDDYSRTISGTYTFQYQNVRGIFVIIYEDSFAEKVLTAGTASLIRGRDIKILNCAPLTFTSAEWRMKGAAGTSNVWITGPDYDNSLIENGDTVIISGTISDQLDQTDTPISGFILGQAVIPEGGNTSESVTVVSQTFIVGPAGAAATVQVGTVTTLPYDAQATVVNSGTANNAVLDFGIPKGIPGEMQSSLPFSQITGSPEDNTMLAGALDEKVAKAGDTMTGSLKFSTANINAIGYQGTKAYYPMIKFKDNTGDTSGNGIYIGGGGLTIIGGGESSNTAAAAFSSGGEKRLILCNDGVIDIWTNCQNGEASATKRTIDNFGNFSGKAANITETVAIANGGTGATTAAAARQNLFNENLASNAEHLIAITANWAKGGYIAKASVGSWIGGICARPNYSISTTDLTAGTSALTTNQLYFVYA